MAFTTDSILTPENTERPAFYVEAGKITRTNAAARQRQFCDGAAICDLLETGGEEYSSYKDGMLALTLRCEDVVYHAVVIRQEACDLFLLESDYSQPELKALALASMHLREPLSNAISQADLLLPNNALQSDPELRKQLEMINRSLYQLQRAVSNMSDAARYHSNKHVAIETRDAVAIFCEVLEKAAALTQHGGRELQFKCSLQPVFCLVNEELLERAILNLISNAGKYAAKDTPISAKLTKSGSQLCFTVENDGPHDAGSNLFLRFLREPGLEDSRNGIGLGLSIVRSAAAAHGGTVLIEQTAAGGFRITMTLRIRCNQDNMLRTPVQLPYDYAGGRDHALVELSNILPPSLYGETC